jgi:Domain of unknown function (DUF4389)
MAEPSDASYNAGNEPPRQVEGAREFPWQRLLLSVLFGFLGWVAFWVTIVAAVVLWIFVAISREAQPDFQRFVASCARYVGQCLTYVAMQREEAPFPMGPWPSAE